MKRLDEEHTKGIRRGKGEENVQGRREGGKEGRVRE